MSTIFEQFHLRHGRKGYTPVFNRFLDSQIADSRLDLIVRVLAWSLRNAWGRHSDACVTEDGIRQGQVDCARDLALWDKHGKPDRRRVNPIFQSLEKLNMIRLDGWEIQPVDDPTLFAPSSPNDGKGTTDSEEKAKISVDDFVEQVWQHSSPEAYADYQKVERRYKEFRTEILSAYKQHAKLSERGPTNEDSSREGVRQDVGEGPDNVSERGPTSPDPSLYENSKTYKGNSSSSSFSSVEEENQEPKPTTTTILDDALRHFGTPDQDLTGQLVRDCRRAAPDCSAEEIAHFVYEKGQHAKRARNPLGLLLSAVPKCFQGDYRQTLPNELLMRPPATPKRGMDKAEQWRQWEKGEEPKKNGYGD